MRLRIDLARERRANVFAGPGPAVEWALFRGRACIARNGIGTRRSSFDFLDRARGLSIFGVEVTAAGGSRNLASGVGIPQLKKDFGQSRLLAFVASAILDNAGHEGEIATGGHAQQLGNASREVAQSIGARTAWLILIENQLHCGAPMRDGSAGPLRRGQFGVAGKFLSSAKKEDDGAARGGFGLADEFCE